MRGLYIHIPFCVRKCLYCDFYSVPARDSLIKDYLKALFIEARSYEGLAFRTLYLGGGTPSLLGPDNLIKLIDGLRPFFDLSGLTEATIEVNPESTTDKMLESARNTGINRISVGVQSLCAGELKSAGRIHSADQAINAILAAKKSGFENVSADLIVGLPGQTWETLETSLEGVVGTGVDHLSLYCLSLEHDTPMALNPPADLPSDDMQADLFERASAFLEDHKFIHYEISNFALPGKECEHNLNYWRGGEYLGLGPAAASHLNGRRWKNKAEFVGAIPRDCPDETGQGTAPTASFYSNTRSLEEEVEELDIKDKAAEEAMLRLRLLVEGLNIQDMAGRYGKENISGLEQRLRGLAEAGDLLCEWPVYRLAPSRVLISNRVFGKVLG